MDFARMMALPRPAHRSACGTGSARRFGGLAVRCYVIHTVLVADENPSPALRAIRAWVRLDAAFVRFNRQLRHEHGITGAQLAVLRIVAEQEGITLAMLRQQLIMHPATLGQLVDRLAGQDLVEVGPHPDDRRRRRVQLTPAGRTVLGTAPLAGPVRLRSVPVDPRRAAALADALEDAVDLFGLTAWEAG